MEAPDVTGSSLTLGTAGSRRTVYLIDETQKIPDTNNQSAELPSTGMNTSTATDTAGVHSAEPQTPGNASQQKNENPSTFLMYNRINTMIAGNSNAAVMQGVNEQNVNDSSVSSTREMPSTAASSVGGDDKMLRKQRTEDKSNSIWYEYGCV